MKVKLINLNIWHGGWRLWDNILEYLKQEQPDILMLQEVYMSEEEAVEPYLKTVASLQKEIGLKYEFQSAEVVISTGHEMAPIGNAIMSRFPLIEPTINVVHGRSDVLQVFEDNPALFANYPRHLLHAGIGIDGTIYNIMTTHGVWAPDGVETESQKSMGKKISQYLHGKPNVILSGDFNINENSECIMGLEEHLVNIFKGERTTSFNLKHKSKPGYAEAVVDFIFASQNIKVLEHRTADADVSDHQSQVVVFDL